MKTTYEKIREIRNKHYPPKLEFGCEILRHKNRPEERYYKVIEDYGYASNDKVVWINSVPFGSMSLPKEVLKSDIGNSAGDWVVLGKPVTLQEVLLILDKTGEYKDVAISPNSGLILVQSNKVTEYPFDLTKPLEEQSEETLQAILKLIE